MELEKYFASISCFAPRCLFAAMHCLDAHRIDLPPVFVIGVDRASAPDADRRTGEAMKSIVRAGSA